MAGNRITYYVVQPFVRDEEGVLYALEPIEARDMGSASRRARAYADAGGGGIAFSRSGDPSSGDWDDAVVIGRYGEIPEEVEA
ncbi:hypothetical protein [Chelatococcus reniformis]|uniref:Uncharacterized protein n=1 Tax=Chelatococcus reniformis TaxID=1494448 RepID=A0A916XGN7_9HYPH|nr:hypothetical protein [Chelatococcus reniformis]GGC70500.1 hypothetical protein GCM10010994_31290 [Chelatococcus reniformis]